MTWVERINQDRKEYAHRKINGAIHPSCIECIVRNSAIQHGPKIGNSPRSPRLYLICLIMAFSLLFAINKQRQTQNTHKTLIIILFYYTSKHIFN